MSRILSKLCITISNILVKGQYVRPIWGIGLGWVFESFYLFYSNVWISVFLFQFFFLVDPTTFADMVKNFIFSVFDPSWFLSGHSLTTVNPSVWLHCLRMLQIYVIVFPLFFVLFWFMVCSLSPPKFLIMFCPYPFIPTLCNLSRGTLCGNVLKAIHKSRNTAIVFEFLSTFWYIFPFNLYRAFILWRVWAEYILILW